MCTLITNKNDLFRQVVFYWLKKTTSPAGGHDLDTQQWEENLLTLQGVSINRSVSRSPSSNRPQRSARSNKGSAAVPPENLICGR